MRGLYRDRIDELTLIAKFLKSKLKSLTSASSVVNVDNSVEWTDTRMKVIKR